MLKVLNATEDLIQGAMGLSQSEPWDRPALPPTQSKRLDEQLSRLEENVGAKLITYQPLAYTQNLSPKVVHLSVKKMF